MRKAYTVKNEYVNELTNDANALVVTVNMQLRRNVAEQVTSGKMTMIAIERLSGIAHATLFQWYKGKFDILRVDLLYRLATVLRVKLTIR